MTDETDEQILARYRELWHDPFLTMSAALELDNHPAQVRQPRGVEAPTRERRKSRQVGAHPAQDFPKD